MLNIVRDGEKLTIHTPAKINIGLRIRGKRSDGFHDLESIVMAVDLTDDLHASLIPADDINLHVETTAEGDVTADDTNLVVRAARLLQQEVPPDRRQGAEIFLNKRIPVGRGLGGGSSDAAATLLMLNQLWQMNLDQNRLIHLAAHLGSDVPFFFNGPLAVMRGRGDIIEPLQFSPPPLFVLLLVPPFPLATASVYHHYALNRPALTPFQSPITLWLEMLRQGRLDELGRHLANDLETPAMLLRPEMRRILGQLNKAGAKCCGMTGSGSAIFALTKSREEAQQLADKIELEKAVLRHVLVPWAQT